MLRRSYFLRCLATSTTTQATTTTTTTATTEQTPSSSPSTTTAAALPQIRHIFNPFNGRMLKESSPMIAELSTLGISESTDRPGTLAVTDSDTLNAFADRVRNEGSEVIMKNKTWPKKMRTLLTGMLRSLNDDEDATTVVNNYLKSSTLERFYRRDLTGAIGGIDGSSGEQAAADMMLQQQQDNSSAPAFKPPTLLDEQQMVVDYALKGYNMFISGDAGTGKTVTLKSLVTQLRSRGVSVAVTASTGLAACHLGGTTFHSFCGMGKTSLTDFMQSSKVIPIVDVIVIDEISMMSGGLMEKFDKFLQGERNNNSPFGGTQIIMCGDFLQLDFVLDRGAARADPSLKQHIFELDVFKNTFVCCKLTKQVRQSDNENFANQLRQLRRATVPSDLFSESSGILKIDDPDMHPVEDETIRLLPTNKAVTEANRSRLERLEGEVSTFVPSATSPALNGDWTSTAILQVEPQRFNVDALKAKLHHFVLQNVPVEMIHYIPRTSIVAYHTHEDGVACRMMLPTQRPEIAAMVAKVWESAISNMNTLMSDPAVSSGGSINENRLADVLPNGDGLHTTAIEDMLNKSIEKHPVACSLPLKVGAPVLLRVNLSNHLVNGSVGTVVGYTPATPDKLPSFMLRSPFMAAALDQYTTHCRYNLGNDEPMIPLVRFKGLEKQEIPIPPWPFAVGGDVGSEYYSIDAVSIPLTLAFAFTVHKVQGLTLLSKVRLELQDMWNCDHIVYVAMSRVKKPEQLSVTGWRDELVTAHPGALSFDKQILSVSDIQEKFLNEKVPTIRGLLMPRQDCMVRASWWMYENKAHNPEKHIMEAEAGTKRAKHHMQQSVQTEDGSTQYTGNSTGVHLNAKQARQVARTMRNGGNNNSNRKDFSMGNRSSKRPSLLMEKKSTVKKPQQQQQETVNVTGTTKQHRPAVAESSAEKEFNLPLKSFTSSSTSSDQLPISSQPAKTTTKTNRAASSSTTATNNKNSSREKQQQ